MADECAYVAVVVVAVDDGDVGVADNDGDVAACHVAAADICAAAADVADAAMLSPLSLSPLRAPAIRDSAMFAAAPFLPFAVVVVVAAAAVDVVVAVVAVEAVVALDSHRLLTICVSSARVCHPKCWRRMPSQLQWPPYQFSIPIAAAVAQQRCHSLPDSNPNSPIVSAVWFCPCPPIVVASTGS